MRQRVALARTILLDRGLILLDEPFGSLDAVTRAEMRHWLLEVMAAHPATWVLVTHDVEEAVLLGDHVAVLHGRPARLTAWTDSPLSRRERLVAAGAPTCGSGHAAAAAGRSEPAARLAAAADAVAHALGGGGSVSAIEERAPSLGSATDDERSAIQAVVIREVGAFELAEVPVPEPGPGEALVRVRVTGLCRTDLTGTGTAT
jgi:hypothetical protein